MCAVERGKITRRDHQRHSRRRRRRRPLFANSIGTKQQAVAIAAKLHTSQSIC